MATQFKVGTTYRLRFIGDHNATVDYTVTKRTDKTVWINSQGAAQKCKIFFCGGLKPDDIEEYCVPMGRFSMSPALYASKEVQS